MWALPSASAPACIGPGPPARNSLLSPLQLLIASGAPPRRSTAHGGGRDPGRLLCGAWGRRGGSTCDVALQSGLFLNGWAVFSFRSRCSCLCRFSVSPAVPLSNFLPWFPRPGPRRSGHRAPAGFLRCPGSGPQPGPPRGAPPRPAPLGDNPGAPGPPRPLPAVLRGSWPGVTPGSCPSQHAAVWPVSARPAPAGNLSEAPNVGFPRRLRGRRGHTHRGGPSVQGDRCPDERAAVRRDGRAHSHARDDQGGARVWEPRTPRGTPRGAGRGRKDGPWSLRWGDPGAPRCSGLGTRNPCGSEPR